MSYDGGLVVKIKNKKLGVVLDDFADKGYFPEESVQSWRDQPEENDWGEIIKPNVKYTIFYSYLDCAYIQGCPKDLADVGRFIVELINIYEDETMSYNQANEIIDRLQQDDVIKDYKLVSWQYYQPGDGELEEFSYKK
jgi:hypothetical protein